MSNYIKVFEILLIGFLFPLSIIYFGLSKYILFFIWIVFFYTIFVYLFFYKSKKILFYVYEVKYNFNLNYFCIIVIRWIVVSILLYFFAAKIFPEKLFIIQRENPTVMYAVLFLYPILSAFPQEFIFCTFFFKRYESLFKKEYILIFMSALIFCFAHVFFINFCRTKYCKAYFFTFCGVYHDILTLYTCYTVLYIFNTNTFRSL